MTEKRLINYEVLQFLKGENSLLDGEVLSIKIGKCDRGVNISLEVSMRDSSQLNKIILDFIDCEDYSFSYSKDHYFYCIESVKLFKSENEMYYLSLDPFDEEEQESTEDMDVIIAHSVKLESIQ